jgi:hypothetical protein
MERKIIIASLLIILPGFLLLSCKKEAGVGGNATIYGKVYAKVYNSTFTQLLEEYYAPDTWVYVVYGDDRDYGDKVKTNYNGTYEFKYLRPGSYRVYSFSKDSALQTGAKVGVIKDVEISKNKETIEVPDIIIFN